MTSSTDVNPEDDHIMRLSLQLHRDKNERNDDLNQDLVQLRRRAGSKSAMFESVLKTQLEKTAKFVAPDAHSSPPRLGLRQNSVTMMRTLTSWEAAQTGSDLVNSSRLDRHRRNQSMGSSISKKPWRM
jgi:hypothetical protein